MTGATTAGTLSLAHTRIEHTGQLHAEMATVIERLRDLVWLVGQRRLARPEHARPIGGGADEGVVEASNAWPPCPVCGQTVMDGEVVILMHGDMIHVDCYHDHPMLARRRADGPAGSRRKPSA